MNRIFLVFLLFLTLGASAEATAVNVQKAGAMATFPPDTATLQLKFTNLKSVNSIVHIALYRDGVNFLGSEPFHAVKVKTQSVAEIETTVHLPAGEYSIAVFQDLNANGHLDKNFIGYPKEPFGFSRNFVPRMSKPSWADTSFRLDSMHQLEIELIR